MSSQTGCCTCLSVRPSYSKRRGCVAGLSLIHLSTEEGDDNNERGGGGGRTNRKQKKKNTLHDEVGLHPVVHDYIFLARKYRVRVSSTRVGSLVVIG